MSIPLYKHGILSYRIPFRTSLPLSSPEFEKTCLGCGQMVIIASGWKHGTNSQNLYSQKPQFHQLAKISQHESFQIYVYSVHVKYDWFSGISIMTTSMI